MSIPSWRQRFSVGWIYEVHNRSLKRAWTEASFIKIRRHSQPMRSPMRIHIRPTAESENQQRGEAQRWSSLGTITHKLRLPAWDMGTLFDLWTSKHDQLSSRHGRIYCYAKQRRRTCLRCTHPCTSRCAVHHEQGQKSPSRRRSSLRRYISRSCC